MNGVRAPAGGLARRLLRRSVLVAAFAGAGWLLTAMFAGGASAAPAPPRVANEVAVTAQAANPAARPASPEASPADGSTGSSTHETRPVGHSTTPPADGATSGDHSGVPPAHEATPATTRPAAPADRPTHDATAVATRPAMPAGRPTEQPTHEAAPSTSRPAAPTDRPAQPPSNSTDPDQEVAPVAELFAAQAPVTEAVPAVQPVATPPAVGLIAPGQPVSQNNNLLGGLTNTVGTITESVVGTVDAAGSVVPVVLVPPTNEPAAILPELPPLLPILGTDPEPLPAGDPAARATPQAPADPRAPPTAISVPAHPSDQVAFPTSAQRTPDKSGGATRGTAAEHANESSLPRPVKVPAPAPAPAGGLTVSTAHDNSAGTHGALAAQTSHEPSAAGFTTRSRATGLSGRIAGLPATSPD